MCYVALISLLMFVAQHKLMVLTVLLVPTTSDYVRSVLGGVNVVTDAVWKS
jgi:hypothetical protein